MKVQNTYLAKPYSLISMVILTMGMGLFSCHPSRTPQPTSEEQAFEQFFDEVGDFVTENPAHVRTLALDRMAGVRDSIVHYCYLLVALKTTLASNMVDSSFLLLNHLEQFLERTPESLRAARLHSEVLNMKGNLLSRYVSNDSATHCFKSAYEWYMRSDRRGPVTDILMNLADAYGRAGHLEKSAAAYRRALFLTDSLQLSDNMRTPIYYGLASTYMMLRDFESCDYYYNLAARNYGRMLPYEKDFYLNNRGNSYYYRGDYETAIDYFKRLEWLNRNYPDRDFQNNLVWLNLSDCFLQLQQPDSASRYLDRCEPFFRKLGLPTAIYYIDTQRMHLFLQRKEYAKAKQILMQSKAGPEVDFEMVHIRNKMLEHYFEEIGDYRKAYRFMKDNARLDDSLRNERIRMRAADLELRYRQDSTLLAQNILIQTQKNRMLRLQRSQLLWLMAIITISFLSFLYYIYSRKKRERITTNLHHMVSTLRWENMRNRMSPHFIFNVLNQHISRSNPEEQREMMNLVKMIRRNLELVDQMSVTLHEEIDFVSTYIDLERKSLGDQFASDISIAPEVDSQNVRIPSMLIQIPVENAIKHALRGKEGERRLWIRLEMKQEEGEMKSDQVVIRVTDNGGGFKQVSSQRGTGTGLKVVMQTIQLLNRMNRQSIEVQVHDVLAPTGEQGCEIAFWVPLSFCYEI